MREPIYDVPVRTLRTISAPPQGDAAIQYITAAAGDKFGVASFRPGRVFVVSAYAATIVVLCRTATVRAAMIATGFNAYDGQRSPDVTLIMVAAGETRGIELSCAYDGGAVLFSSNWVSTWFHDVDAPYPSEDGDPRGVRR